MGGLWRRLKKGIVGRYLCKIFCPISKIERLCKTLENAYAELSVLQRMQEPYLIELKRELEREFEDLKKELELLKRKAIAIEVNL